MTSMSQSNPQTTTSQFTYAPENTYSSSNTASSFAPSRQLPIPDSSVFNTSNPLPAVSTPSGGGAIRGIGEKFSVGGPTGTASTVVPILCSPGRSGSGPQLSLVYNSGVGNGPFGLGWDCGLGSVVRKTDKGLPRYRDIWEAGNDGPVLGGADDGEVGDNSDGEDVFILGGMEDLCPILEVDLKSEKWKIRPPVRRIISGKSYTVRSYRPRIEGSFIRTEFWRNDSTGGTHWRSINRENVTSIFGASPEARIFDPNNPQRVFSWLLSRTFDDKGNVVKYEYKAENDHHVDITQSHERNRTGASRTVARYLKRIKYGNRVPIPPKLCQEEELNSDPNTAKHATKWLFELVFDYGEHDVENPSSFEKHPWAMRTDPFSTYRAGFEVRMYRLCRRVLMFHHFEEERDVGMDCLVGSTNMVYNASHASVSPPTALPHHAQIVSLLSSVSQSHYVRNPSDPGPAYLSEFMPPVEFQYTEATFSQTIQSIDPCELENLPAGASLSSQTQMQWIDLDAEGIPGLLTKQSGEWYYKPNLGSGRFGPLEALPTIPSQSTRVRPWQVRHGGQQFMDLAGDGRVDLVSFEGSSRGFYKRDWTAASSIGAVDKVHPNGSKGTLSAAMNGNWEPFQHFIALPQIDWNDPNLQFVDLTGDGLADLLIINDDIFTYYPSAGELGFSNPHTCYPGADEDSGPRILLSTANESIFLADMSGDGLIDLVRIRPQEITYWPNLGYGRFGSKVAMTNSPYFDFSDIFRQGRLRLADINGAGLTDIIYLDEREGPTIYFNQAGNSWSEPVSIPTFPHIDDKDVGNIAVVDILGHGTGCLVWTSTVPSATAVNGCNNTQQVKYIDLMSTGKPYLLTSMVNNLGSETHIRYQSSTEYYLQDKAAGKERGWRTKLPFPVQVVENVYSVDRISGNVVRSRFRYSDGFWDPWEREFRGFGVVEEWEGEEFQEGIAASPTNHDPAFRSPPTYVKRWYDTGAYLRGQHIAELYYHDYYRPSSSPSLVDLKTTGIGHGLPSGPGEFLPPVSIPRSIRLTNFSSSKSLSKDHNENGIIIPYDLNPQETREAYRALKGLLLREEIYGLDETEYDAHPYVVKEMRYDLQCFQPITPGIGRGVYSHGVFFARPREGVEVYYERGLGAFGEDGCVIDARVVHTLTIDVDVYGNVMRSVVINYGRRKKRHGSVYERDKGNVRRDGFRGLLSEEDNKRQEESHMLLTSKDYTNPVDGDEAWRTPVAWQSQSFEITNFPARNDPDGAGLYSFGEVYSLMKRLGNGKHDIPFESELITAASKAVSEHPSHPSRRLLSCEKVQFRSNDLSNALPFGELESLSLPFETYKQIFTPGLLESTYIKDGRIPSGGGLETILKEKGAYVKLEGSQGWWCPSGRAFFSPQDDDTPVQEKEYASRHFYRPCRYRDAFYGDSFKSQSRTTYDKYDLLTLEMEDSMANKTTAGLRLHNQQNPAKPLVEPRLDYRVLASALVQDPNLNITECAYDIMARVTAIAVQGKPLPNRREGDELSGFKKYLSEQDIAKYLEDPISGAKEMLGNASSRIVYDYLAYYRTKGGTERGNGGEKMPKPMPPTTATIMRERHVHGNGDLGDDTEESRLGLAFLYVDGVGRAAQMKGLADLNTTIGDQRWLTTGWTIYNNKGNPVRKFEPFFSTTHQYEFETVVGVSKTLLYDALQRNILSINPDHTWTKTVTTPWSGQSWDASDTLLLDPLNDPDVKGYFQLLPKDDFLPGWYDARTGRLDGGMGSKDREAAMMAALYAGTPSTSFFDAFGRRIVMAMHNRRKHSASQHPGSGKHEKRPNGVEDEFVLSRMYYDVVGNTLKVKDARGRIVQRNTYDMTKRSMRKESMEAGKAWTLVDCGGKTVLAWDGRGFEELLVYDTNGRAVREYLRKIGDDGGCDEVKTPALVLVITYGEEEKGAEQRNARGRMVFVRDQTGTKRMESFDFRSNLLGETHVLSGKMDGLIDWSDSEAVSVENESWTTHMTYDALNRVVQRTEPDGSLVRQLYNRSSQIKRVEMKLCGTKGWRDVLSNAEYNARGQPVLRVLGNGVQTRCEHDPLTFRLIRLLSLSRTWTRSGCDADHGRPSSPRVHTLQDFKYTYDPMGNIISIQDDSNEPIFFNNQKVNPSNEYSYDALYRLITASGREHLGLTQQQSDPGDPYQVRSYSAEDGHAMSRYHEELFYDKAGNMTKLQHHGNSSWTKHFSYDEPSQLEPKKHKNNRLSSTRVGKDVGAFKYEGSEGLVGNMTTMPSLSVIRWDFRSQLQATARQRCEGIPETTYYQYTDGGQRKRKVTMRRVETGSKEQATRKSDRVYLGSFEIFRKYGVDGKSINLERQTLSISVGDERLVVQEVLTAGTSPGPAQLTRYQLGNHLGSAVLELDASAKTLTYEEYFPYGGTSYQASLSQVDAPKRYRYSGKERDEESGLYYYGSRYYSTSIARWISPDPAGMRDNTNLYLFVRCNPITYKDPDGQQLEEVMSSPVAWAEIGAAALAVGEVVLGAISLPVLIVAVVAVAAVVALEYAAEDERDYELKGPKWYPDAPKTPAPWESPPEPDTLPPGGPPETPPVEPPTAPPEAPPETPPTTPEPTTPEPTGPETTPKPVEPEPGTDTTVKPKPDIDVGPDDIADPLPDPKPDPKPRRPPDKDWHHIYPQVYRGIFEQAGIQIDIDAAKNGRMVDRQYHHKFSSAFQKDWTIFLFSSVDEYGKMRKTRAEIEKEALILADKYGTWVVETGRHQSHPVPRPWLTP